MSFFGKHSKSAYRESTHSILDRGQRFPITLEYANQGYEEGWLELVEYYIDTFNVEHCTYRQVPSWLTTVPPGVNVHMLDSPCIALYDTLR